MVEVCGTAAGGRGDGLNGLRVVAWARGAAGGVASGRASMGKGDGRGPVMVRCDDVGSMGVRSVRSSRGPARQRFDRGPREDAAGGERHAGSVDAQARSQFYTSARFSSFTVPAGRLDAALAGSREFVEPVI